MANPLTDVFGDVPQGQPPGDELGAAHQVGAPGGWAPFLDEAEYVPELTWPSSIATYHRMRSDTQIEALHLGSTQPVREYRWMIDPNGAPRSLVENAATDLGLPIKTPEEEGAADQGHVKRAATKFNFGTFLEDALSGPLYGFMPFEIVGEVQEGKDWRMRKLAPRHPRTIQQFKETRHGDLEAIRQTFGPDFTIMPEPIPATSLLHFVWRGEAGSHVGRSMLRSMYREWLVKERVIRILPINIERAGGVPWVEGPQGASNKQLAELGTLARQFKVAEGGGGALPFGSKLNLAGIGGGVPDGLGLLTYCDEAMARVWALMLIQLGQTATGSRALGGEFAIYAARAQRLMGKWVTGTVNDFLDRYVEWNEPLADYAPRLIFEPSQPEGLSVTDLVSLLDSGALTVDPELESWLRAEYSLPKKPEAPEHEDLGELTPDEVALVQNSRNPPPLPAYTANPDVPTAPGGTEQGGKTFTPTPGPRKSLDPTSISPTAASGPISLPRLHRGIRASLTLPARELRRAPTANEIRAAVDFAGLDSAHRQAVSSLERDYLNGTLPAQIGHLADAVRGGTKVGDLRAPIVGHERLVEHLQGAARSGVESAVREGQVQGITFTPSQIAEAHATAQLRAAEQAEHVANLNAHGLTLGAQRRAGRITNTLRGREGVAKDLERHLEGQKHVFERENLKGAVTVAQNGGRIAAMEAATVEPGTATYEASEILDDRTCGPCEAIDGTEYDSLEEAQADYGSGGYVDCDGGPNCRGTLVAVYAEQNPQTGEGPLGEAEPAYIGPTGPDTGDTSGTGDDGGGVDDSSPEEAGEPAPTPELPPEPAPSAVPEPAPAQTPQAPEAGPLLAKAEGIIGHDEAVAFLKNEVGIPGEVDFGEKLRNAATAKVKPGSQAEINQEHALDYIKQLTESVAEAKDTFGDGVRLDNIVANSRAKEIHRAINGKAKGLGSRAPAAIRTWRGLGGRNELIFNDGYSFEKLASKTIREDSAGYVSRATTDPRGVIMHEMGHALEDGLSGLHVSLPRLLADAGLASTAQARGTARFISTYATTVSHETWAESFATLMRPGGVDADFSAASTGNLQLDRMLASADADTKASLVKLREGFNAWLDENHPGTPHLPER